jgi:hypothetical protein
LPHFAHGLWFVLIGNGVRRALTVFMSVTSGDPAELLTWALEPHVGQD